MHEEECQLRIRVRTAANNEWDGCSCGVGRLLHWTQNPTEVYRKLDLVLARLETIEQRLNQQSQDKDVAHVPFPVHAPGLEKPQLVALHPKTRGIVKLNQQTGCFEYYGM